MRTWFNVGLLNGRAPTVEALQARKIPLHFPHTPPRGGDSFEVTLCTYYIPLCSNSRKATASDKLTERIGTSTEKLDLLLETPWCTTSWRSWSYLNYP